MRSLGLGGSASVTAPAAPCWSRELGSRGCKGKRGILQPWDVSELPVLQIPWEQQVWSCSWCCAGHPCKSCCLSWHPLSWGHPCPRAPEPGGSGGAAGHSSPTALSLPPHCPLAVPSLPSQHGSDLFQARRGSCWQGGAAAPGDTRVQGGQWASAGSPL